MWRRNNTLKKYIIWPALPRACFHCKTIRKISVLGPYALGRTVLMRKMLYGPGRNTYCSVCDERISSLLNIQGIYSQKSLEMQTSWPRAKYFPVRPSHSVNKYIYLFLWSWEGGILRILQSDWFRERAVFSYLLTTVMVTNYAKRRVNLRIERAKFQFVIIVFCNRAVLLFNFLIKNNGFWRKLLPSSESEFYYPTMRKIKTWLLEFFLIVSPTF